MFLRFCLAAAVAVAAAGCTPKPTVVSFTAQPSTVTAGDPTTLRWEVTDAESVQINSVPTLSPDATQVVVRPTQTTTYTLTARNGAGSVTSAPVTVTVTAPPVSDQIASQPWNLFGPDGYSGNTLTVTVPSLAANERLAVIVLNVGGQDHTAGSNANNVQLSVTGTGSFPVREAPASPKQQAPLRPARMDTLRAHDEIHALNKADVEARLAAGERRAQPARPAPVPALPTNTSFCTRRGTATPSVFTRRTATLRHESAHLAIYVDDADLADFASREPGIWTSLEADWEGASGIYNSVTGAFGPESDVDGNGKLTVFFSDELGAPSNGGVLLGYFYAGDTLFAQDVTANCSGTRSNGADLFFMNGIGNLLAAGFSGSEVVSRVYPDTLAHEFQHLINANAHCLLEDCNALEDVWLNEGLSMVAEDIAGFGWNEDRSAAEMYVDRLSGPDLFSYNRRSLTVWEGDPIGNYQGVHSLVRYWADRYGEEILKDLVSGSLHGTTRTEAVLDMPFAEQLAEWATALMFSNETFSPSADFDFTGADWTPFHQKVNYVNHVPLNPGGTVNGSVRKDGWNAFVTGTGSGGDASLTVTSALSPKPRVVVVRFTGSLPQCKGVLSAITGACP